jgi:hypothetical protein
MILFSIFLGKDVRFIVPIFLPIAIITGQGIYDIGYKALRHIFIALVIIIGFFQFMAYSFKIPIFPQLAYRTLEWNNIVFFDSRPYSCYRTYPENLEWGIKDVLLSIRSNMRQGYTKEPVVLFLSNHEAYNPNAFLYYKEKEKIQCRVFSVYDAIDTDFMSKNEYNYVILKDKDATDIESYKKRIQEVVKYIREHPEEFSMIYQKKLPDGSNILIYKHG